MKKKGFNNKMFKSEFRCLIYLFLDIIFIFGNLSARTYR